MDVLYLHVVYGDSSVCHPGDDHVRVLRVDVDAHDAAVRDAQVLGVGRVLQGEDADVAVRRVRRLLLVKVVGAERSSEQVRVVRVPAEARDLQALK